MSEQLRSSVTIYSSGTAVVTKEHAIPDGGPLKLSIPVKKRDLDTVVSSISVLGDVSLPEPLSYQPTNINPTDLTLDANTVRKGLAAKLRGAKVRLKGPGTQILEGTLAGTEDFQDQTQQGIINRYRIVVMTNDGDLRTVEDRNIDALTFTDENDRREIQKALQRSYQAIRPESAFVEVTIVPNNGATRCAVQYVTTAPSPKTRYQLRQRGEKWELEAEAVVTNDSEEDWRTPDGQGVYVSVVTGELIDFDTDLAEISRPRRQKVNLSRNQALGAVVAEESVPAEMLPSRADPGIVLSPRPMLGSVAQALCLRQSLAGDYDQLAQLVQSDIRDVGDFAVFDSPTPIIINSNKSALVPLKTWELRDVNPVLLYNESKHARHPWQAKRFKNETGITLGKGVAIVLKDGEFAGKAVLESVLPNEEAFLIHALENGVKVFVEHGQVESRYVRFNISNGVALCESLSVSETVYKINNQKAVAFKLEIEHQQQLPGGDRHEFEFASPTGQVRMTQTVTGARFGVELPASEKVMVTVREIQVQEQSMQLQDPQLTYLIDAGLEEVVQLPHLLRGSQGQLSWLVQNLVNSEHPLASNRQLQACIAAQQELEQAAKKIQEAEYQVKTIEQEQERLKGLIPVTHSGDSNELKTQVADNEKHWRELKRTTIPALHEAIRMKAAALQETLGNLSLSWSEDRGGNGDSGGLRGAIDKFARAFGG